MKRTLNFAAAAALLVAAGLAHGQDAINIKVKIPAEGEVGQVEKTETVDAATKVVDATGKAVVDEKHKTVSTSVYKETILKCEPKKNPTKMERVYEKATETTDGKTVTLPYQGKTVVIEKKDGTFHFTVDGKEMSADDAKPLAKEFAKEGESAEVLMKALLPKNPVKPGDSWNIDMGPIVKDIAKSGEIEIDADKSKGTATLLKAYKKDDKQFGEIKVTMALPIKALSAANTKLPADAGSAANADMKMDVCIDGTSTAGTVKGGMKLDLKSAVPDGKGGTLPLTVSVQVSSEETRSEPKK
jgi:hypothetical protein